MSRKLHVTEVGLFDQCERRYYYEKIEGEEAPENHYVVVGKVYHQALARSFPDASPHAGRFREAAAESIQDHAASLSEVGVSGDYLLPEVAERLEELRTYFPERLAPTFVERQYSSRGWEGTVDWAGPDWILGDERIKGPDRPEWGHGELGVLDWKTVHSNKRRRSSRDARFSPQLAKYALEVGAKHAAFIEVPRDRSLPFVFLPVHYSDEDLRDWKIWFDNIRRSIMRRRSKESFKMCKRDNPLCSAVWCPFYFRCFPHLEPLTTEEGGATVAP